MTGGITISWRRPAINRWFAAAMLLYAAVAIVSLRQYAELTSVNFLLGAGTLYLLSGAQAGGQSGRYAYVAIAFALLSIVLPVKTILYFAVGAAVLFTMEQHYGRNGFLPFVVIAFMAPIFKYFTSIFSFPIRLQLTSWAGRLLSLFNNGVRVKGNIIYSGGQEFAVDPECMGLSMLVTSLMLSVMFIAIFQQRYARRCTFWQTAALLPAVAMLNVIANLVRIVCLVQFSIMPGNWLHDATGLVCLLVYVIAPAAWMSSWLIRRHGVQTITADLVPKPLRIHGLQWLRHLLVAVAILLAAMNVHLHHRRAEAANAAVPLVKGYHVQRVSADILKLENAASLLYLKRIAGFYNTDHHPMICWKGSGYAFYAVREELVEGAKVFTAVLRNGKDQLYTAWWYDNGEQSTTQQIKWRLDVLKGAHDYSVVNVTAPGRRELIREIAAIKRNRDLTGLLQHQ